MFFWREMYILFGPVESWVRGVEEWRGSVVCGISCWVKEGVCVSFRSGDGGRGMRVEVVVVVVVVLVEVTAEVGGVSEVGERYKTRERYQSRENMSWVR
jgi:hypothetical protein